MGNVPALGLATALASLVLLFPILTPVLGAQTRSSESGNPGTAALKNLTLEELSRIEVTTVSKEPTDAFKTPAAINVLTREDIARSGLTTIPDLLRLLPGVEVAQISSDKWAIGIRGFQGYLSKSVLVLINGRSVYTPLFAGVYWEMQDTLLEDIERIEVIRGPGGTIWGANAVNGVINIITRNARDTRSSMVTVLGGNVEQAAIGVRYGAGSDKFAYRFWGKGFTRGPQFHSDGGNFDDWQRGQIGLRADWAPSTRDSVTITANVYSVKAGSRVAISTYSPPAMFNAEANADFFGQNFITSWRRAFQSGAGIELKAYFDRTDRRDLNYREVRKTFDFDFIAHFPAGSNNFLWGLGARTSPSRFFQTVPTVDFTPEKNTFNIYSGFVQDSIALVPAVLTATIGSKFEHNNFSGFEYQPSIRLAWTPTEQQTGWVAVTRAVRTPSRLEEGFHFTALAVPGLPLYLRLIGDGQFDSEQLVGYEAGYRSYIQKRGFVSISAFYNQYDNLLSVENQPPAPEASPEPAHLVLPLFLRNGIRAQTKGFEVASLWDLWDWWRVLPSYSFMHLNADRNPGSNDASTVKQLEGDSPEHKVVVQSLFTLPGSLTADLRYRYVSSLLNQKVAAYSTADFSVGKKISRAFALSVSGQNLLQPHHPEYGGLPGPIVEIRRSGFLKLTWTP